VKFAGMILLADPATQGLDAWSIATGYMIGDAAKKFLPDLPSHKTPA